MMDSDAPKRRWLHWVALACILALAIALRVIGLRWGLPNELHSYSYHPDEFLTVGASAKMAGLVDGHRTINPGLYNYPSLYLYLTSLAMMVAGGYGWLGSTANVYLAARVVTVLMSVGAVGATYWAGRVLFGNAAGLLAALIIAIAPLHVQHSHFATVDVPSTLFVALCLGFSSLILKHGSRRDYILAGVMTGLACGTKYNAVLVIFAPIASHFLSEASHVHNQLPLLGERGGVRARRTSKGTTQHPDLRRRMRPNFHYLWLIPACAIAAFIFSTPGSVLYTRQFLYGIGYEMQHQAAGHGLVFVGTGNGFVYTLTSSLLYGLSPLLLIIAIAAAAYGAAKRDIRVLTILAFALPYYILISSSQVRFARYTLPLFPAIALVIGWLVPELMQLFSWTRRLPVLWRGIWTIFVCGALVFCLAWSVFFNLPFIGPAAFAFIGGSHTEVPNQCDQDGAARWISAHFKPGDTVGMIDYPWYYSPPLNRGIALDILPQRVEAVSHTPYKITVFSAPAGSGWYTKALPRWVIVTREETADAERLRGSRGLSPSDQVAVGRIGQDLAVVRSRYLLRWSCGKVAWDIVADVPHDMRYNFPGIKIYELKP